MFFKIYREVFMRVCKKVYLKTGVDKLNLRVLKMRGFLRRKRLIGDDDNIEKLIQGSL